MCTNCYFALFIPEDTLLKTQEQQPQIVKGMATKKFGFAVLGFGNMGEKTGPVRERGRMSIYLLLFLKVSLFKF